MADENKPAFYPRVGRNIAKNFRSAKPAPFIDDPRAMDLPQYGDIDLSQPTKSNLEMGRRMTQRDADLKRQQSADTSPLEKAAGALQSVRLMGSALTQAINSMPTRIAKGDAAAEQFMQERMYKPEQPLAYEYAGDIGNLLERLETEYKLPPILPEAVALQYLSGPAMSQATRTAGRGAEQAGRAIERRMEPVVKGALEQGGLPREMVMAMGANTQSNVIKPSGKGANWLDGKNASVEAQLGKMKMADWTTPEEMSEMQKSIDTAKRIMADDPNAQRTVNQMENELSTAKRNNAVNSWIDSNLRNYVKNQMATPDDPVRKLAEEGILHMAPYGDQSAVSSRLMNKRMGLGQDPLGMGKSDAARFWERQADISVDAYPAGSYKHGSLDESLLSDNPWLQKVPDETMIYTGKGLGGDLGFDHIIDVLRQDVREGRIRPEQLNKVSMEQAVRRTHEYDQEMARKMAESQAKATEGMPVRKEYPEGYKWLELTTPKIEALPEGASFQKLSTGLTQVVDSSGNPLTVPAKDEAHALRMLERESGQQTLEDALKYEGTTMGHCVGGYCPDVLEGRSRIFSLRDAKGEPHVTVEVRPTKGQNKFQTDWFSQQPEEVQDKITQQALAEHALMAGNRTPQEDRFTWGQALSNAIKSQMGDMPDEIIQIKGKQNRAPKEQYLPFVQDFVKGGNWSTVGDLKNTGMVDMSTYRNLSNWLKERGIETPRYVTKEEFGKHEGDYLLDELKPPPTPDVPPNLEGMKRGGVAISNNPDTMMLELGNKKMKNGVPAYGGAGAVIKQGLKAAKPEVMKASEALGKIEGRPLKITQADRTKVGGGYLGGPGFSGLQLTEPEYRAAEAAWAVQNAGTAKTILGGGGDNAVYAAMLGTPTQHQSNQMVFDKLLGDFKKAAKRGELTPELRDLINMRLAAAVDNKGNPVFPANVDIMDKKFRDIADTFSRRSVAGHLMGGVQVGGKKGQIIDYDKIIRNTTDPALLDQPTGALGNRLFTLSGGIVQRPDLHPAFPTILQGEDLGVMFTPVERDIVMKDFVEKTMREKGRKPGYMDYTRGNPPTQLITEDILTELQKLGKKKGGAVKQPAAYIDGNEFVEAAQKYGIRDSMSNLNMIVNLVNKGLTVDDAARQVADSGMHKAEGGSVSGDDLIIEERPL